MKKSELKQIIKEELNRFKLSEKINMKKLINITKDAPNLLKHTRVAFNKAEHDFLDKKGSIHYIPGFKLGSGKYKFVVDQYLPTQGTEGSSILFKVNVGSNVYYFARHKYRAFLFYELYK